MNYTNLQNGSDIRGIALDGIKGEEINLTKEAVYDLARGFVKYLRLKTNQSSIKISVGHDSRLSANTLQQAIIDGLLFDGVEVMDCSLASTPAMFMSCVYNEFKCDGAIMITASHLPFNRNGMKFFDKDGGLNKEDIKTIIQYAQNQDFSHIVGASCTKVNLMEVYASKLRDIIKQRVNSIDYDHPLKNLHIIIDAGNGAGGFYATDVLQPLGANIEGSQFLEPDGNFPNHIPNPEDKQAMASICEAVKQNKADLGIIFDTDVDRSSAVDHNGNPISRNAIVALAAILANTIHAGTTVVTDSVTSDELHEFLIKHGIGHHRFKRGYKNVINEGIRLNENGIDCQLAIETSGHAAFKENYFLDDGAYLATLIVIEAAKHPIADLISDLEYPKEEKELRFKIVVDEYQTVGDVIIEDLKKYVSKQDTMTLAQPNYEGVRVCFEHGWLLVRKSLHEPIIPCNIESKKEGGCKEIAKELYIFLKNYSTIDLSPLETYLFD